METFSYCPHCGTKSVGGRFCVECGFDLRQDDVDTSAERPNVFPDEPQQQNAQPFSEPNANREGVIESGQWLVGKEVPPGLYRYSGSFSRIDENGNLVSIAVAYSGLGLARVYPEDYSVDVVGEATRADLYGPYPVLEKNPGGGCYLVGVDIAPGQYRISNGQDLASWTTFDRNMQLINIRNNHGQILLTLDPSVFAVEFQGNIEPI